MNSEKEHGTRPKKQNYSPNSKDRSASPKKKPRRAELPQIKERHHKRWYKETGKKLVSTKHRDEDLGIFSKILKNDGKDGGKRQTLNGLIFLQDPDYSSGQKVSFGTIEFRNYTAMPSLNPAVSSGPAVQLGWDFSQEQVVDLDYYEKCRIEWLESNGKPRDMNDVHLNDRVRLDRLRDAGYNVYEIADMIRQTNALRIEREKSLKHYMRWKMTTKNIKRYFHKVSVQVLGLKQRPSLVHAKTS